MTPTTYGRDFAYCLKSHGGVRYHIRFNSGAKNLQNSSRIQKISIKFAVVMGMGIYS